MLSASPCHNHSCSVILDLVIKFSASCCSVAKSCPTLCNQPHELQHNQALESSTITQSLLKFMSIESVMSSTHLILCHPLLLPPSIFPSIRVFPSESALHIRWPKYWSFNFSISPSNEYSGLVSSRLNWLISLQSKGLPRVFSSTTECICLCLLVITLSTSV